MLNQRLEFERLNRKRAPVVRSVRGFMQLQPDTYTVETLAEKVGRSEKYVYARLRLLHLIDEAQQASTSENSLSPMPSKSHGCSRTTSAAH
jgi:hypothetical protein